MLSMGIKGKILVLIVLAAFMISGAPAVTVADDTVKGFRETELPLPRFVSLRAERVYVRAGPAMRYPVKWVYKRDHMPVEIIQEFENWRKIRDFEGDEGWVHSSLLTGDRTALVRAEDMIPLREGFSGDARMVARLEPMVIARLDKCIESWCRVKTGSYHGWVERNFLWGIYDDEDLN